MNQPPEEPNDYYYPSENAPRKRTTQIAILAMAVIILVGGSWWLSQSTEKTEEPETPAPEPVMETSAPEPEAVTPEPMPEPEVVDIQEPEPTPVEPEPEPIQLPSLDNSDDFVRTTLMALSEQSAHKEWLQSDNLVRRGTAIADGLSRGELIQKFIPIKPPSGKFKATKQGPRHFISEENYQRYNPVVDNLVAVEPEQMAKTLKLLQPLMENAFDEQGYPDRSYNDMLIEAIDELLATPSYDQPPELLLESVHYQFEDPAIEALSDAQKQLIRSGPENTQKLQKYLEQLKSELSK